MEGVRICYIGKFQRLHDEEYIAQSFESIGCRVDRVEITRYKLQQIWSHIMVTKPDLVLFAKFPYEPGGNALPAPNQQCVKFIEDLRAAGIKTATWIFDIYWDSYRRQLLRIKAFFLTDYVFTTDGGHAKEWKSMGVFHRCVRQGIFKPECRLLPEKDPEGIVFIGDNNIFNVERVAQLEAVQARYGQQFHWYGQKDPNEIRGMELNELYARSKIVIGDSIHSPQYWSNRVVETLGRGGFLIHQEVPGLSEEYPHLVTYPRGDIPALLEKIEYYLTHETERRAIVRKNFEWVRDRYTCDKKCAQLLSFLGYSV